jgi:hypothetical protein
MLRESGHPVELVIGLAGGETRWRMMTVILIPVDE